MHAAAREGTTEAVHEPAEPKAASEAVTKEGTVENPVPVDGEKKAEKKRVIWVKLNGNLVPCHMYDPIFESAQVKEDCFF